MNFMNLNWKTWAVIVVAIVVVGIFVTPKVQAKISTST